MDRYPPNRKARPHVAISAGVPRVSPVGGRFLLLAIGGFVMMRVALLMLHL